MPVEHELTVTLTPELEKIVEARIASGRFASASDVLCEGLRRLEIQDREDDAAYSDLKKKLEKAAAEAERGELLDGEQVMARLRAKLEARRVRKPDAA